MSWLGQAFSQQPTPGPTQGDPNPRAEVKPANRPFLVYKAYREEQDALHQAWLVRKKEWEEKKARGEKVGRLERDPTAPVEVGPLELVKFLLLAVILFFLAGKFYTGDFMWDYKTKWTTLKAYIPTNDRLFSERTLAIYDGSVAERPIFIAIDGIVYDVTSKKETYGPGGSYSVFAGIDAARAFATGCFETHRTHDIRGLSPDELKSLEHWKKFFAEHDTYFRVGRVSHPPINPEDPIPAPCDGTGQQGAEPKKITKESVTRPDPEGGNKVEMVHEEL